MIDVPQRDPAIPGVAVAVVQGDDASFVCDGITSVDHPLPVTPDTVFQIGSVTKTFVATAVWQLVCDGRLSLDTRIARLLPDAALPSALTVEHLLTHTGGWAGDWALMHPMPSRDADALAAFVNAASAVPRLFPPGGPFSYDNFGWCVLGRALEVVVGMPFDDGLRSLVVGPLELPRTAFAAEDVITERVAAGHYPDGPDGSAAVARRRDAWADNWSMRRCLWPAGGLSSTAADLAAWARHHLHDATVASMQVPRVESGGQGTQAGYGWHIRRAGDIEVVSHSGLAQGFAAQLVLVPKRDAALVVLTNANSGSPWLPNVVDRFLHETCEIALDEPVRVPSSGLGALIGTYTTETRTLVVRAGSDDSVVLVDIVDDGPTWYDRSTHTMTGAAGDRLVGVDDSAVRMEYGVHDGVRWLRFRGRIHVASNL